MVYLSANSLKLLFSVLIATYTIKFKTNNQNHLETNFASKAAYLHNSFENYNINSETRYIIDPLCCFHQKGISCGIYLKKCCKLGSCRTSWWGGNTCDTGKLIQYCPNCEQQCSAMEGKWCDNQCWLVGQQINEYKAKLDAICSLQQGTWIKKQKLAIRYCKP